MKENLELVRDENEKSEITKKLVAGIIYSESSDSDGCQKVIKQLRDIKDRLTFQDFVIDHMTKFNYKEVFEYSLGEMSFKKITSEKEWKDYRGLILYMLNKLASVDFDTAAKAKLAEYKEEYDKLKDIPNFSLRVLKKIKRSGTAIYEIVNEMI